MASYREILAVQKDPARARALAMGLCRLDDMDWTDWELDFLHSMSERHQELTTRQGEKLVELSEDAAWYHTVEGFSLQALIDRCHILRDELTEHDARFIEQLKARNATRLRRKDAQRLLRCARSLGEIEPYQGRSLDRLPAVDPARAEIDEP